MSANLLKDKCFVCKFFCPPGVGIVEGNCQRYPPTLVAVTPTDTTYESYPSYWPSVATDDWCGEFKPKETL